jgi:GNAT superfamily N-acetyltransferase
MVEWQLRQATVEDLPALAEIYLRARTAAEPAMPPGIHPADEVREWVSGWDLAKREVWLAAAPDGLSLGFAAVADDWLHSLYVDPDAAGNGVGSALLDVTKQLRPDGFCLWVFESNTPARTFYANRGLIELERTDGAANEEKAPDIRMAWPGADPLGFLGGLLDDVEQQQQDLDLRRAAVTRAVERFRSG